MHAKIFLISMLVACGGSPAWSDCEGTMQSLRTLAVNLEAKSAEIRGEESNLEDIADRIEQLGAGDANQLNALRAEHRQHKTRLRGFKRQYDEIAASVARLGRFVREQCEL